MSWNVWIFWCFSICFHLVSWFPSKLLPHFLTDIIQLSEWNTATFCDHRHCDKTYPAWLNHLHIIGDWRMSKVLKQNPDHITISPSPGLVNVVNILPVNNFFQATSNQSNIIYFVRLRSDSLNKIRNYSTWQRSFNCKISLKSYKMFLKNLNPIFCLLHTTSFFKHTNMNINTNTISKAFAAMQCRSCSGLNYQLKSMHSGCCQIIKCNNYT